MKCPRCQHDNPTETNYCGKCGMPLSIEGGTAVYSPDTVKTLFQKVQTGTVIDNRYEVIDELGRGGMGTVYKVFDNKIKEKVALKLIRPEIALNDQTVERFRNEIKLARKITHGNICRLYDLGEEGPSLFITMEYIKGQDLKQMLKMASHSNAGTAVTVAKQICDGLVESHRLGVVHRDLKPQNVMIDTEGKIKIMDFGIARSLSSSGFTATGVLIGTPEYMSPEQAEGKGVDERTDIYSLGIILYEMVTKKVPFSGDTPLSVAIKHKDEIPADPREFNPETGEDLSRIILKCLEKDKNKRYQTAEDLLTDLTRIEQGIPTIEKVIPQRKIKTSKEIRFTRSPKRLLVPALIVIGAIVIGIAAWQLFFNKGGSDPRSVREGISTTVVPIPEVHEKHLTVRTAENARNPGTLFQIPSLKSDALSRLEAVIVNATGNLGEFEKAQIMWQLMTFNPIRWTEEISEDDIDKFFQSLEGIKKVVLGEGPNQDLWENIMGNVSQAKKKLEDGDREGAQKIFTDSYREIREHMASISSERSADSFKRFSRTRSPQEESESDNILRSLALTMAEAGDEAYEEKNFAEANIRYALGDDIFAMASRCRTPQECSEEMARFADRKKNDADRFQASQFASTQYTRALNFKETAEKHMEREDVQSSTEFYIQSALHFEMAKEEAIENQKK